MSTLLLRLAGPMQSWGSASKFDRRLTELEPTKSGVLGMLACAMGIRREESLAIFADITFGVRIDQSGELDMDFQMVHKITDTKKTSSWVTRRQYLLDAVFLAGIEGQEDFLRELEQALRYPAFPLYLGRRSCPPAGPVGLGIRDKSLSNALREEPWLAHERYQRQLKKRGIKTLEILREPESGEEADYSLRDEPISFSQKKRMYRFRNLMREHLPLSCICADYEENSAMDDLSTTHDPMELLEENYVSIKS